MEAPILVGANNQKLGAKYSKTKLELQCNSGICANVIRFMFKQTANGFQIYLEYVTRIVAEKCHYF
jgi:hypothetical protein